MHINRYIFQTGNILDLEDAYEYQYKDSGD